METNYLSEIGLLASFALPLFNLPLIFRMMKRQSSEDISLIWVLGVWICILLMTPVALTSKDLAFRVFGVMNIAFFTAVVFFTLKYRFVKRK